MPLATIRRAFAVDPNLIPATHQESSILSDQKIVHPVNQTYFAWRRSVMLFVVWCAVLGAGLSTYRDLFESNERTDVIDAITRRIPFLQQAGLSTLIEGHGGSDRDENVGDHAPGQPEPSTRKQSPDVDSAEVRPEIAKPASDHPDENSAHENGEAEHGPARIGHAEHDNAKADSVDGDQEGQTAFGRFTDVVQLSAYYAIPVAALAVVMLWNRFQTTFRIIVGAFAFSFLIPMVIALCPWSWWGYVEPHYSPTLQPIKYYRNLIEGFLEAATYLVTLLPTVISLVPGVQRSCIRVKMLSPQSTLPGWILVVASPFYALFLLVVLVSINQFDSHVFFLAGMLLFLLAPLWYCVRGDVLTRPLTSAADFRQIRMVQRVVGLTTLVAGLLILVSLCSRDVLGVRLLGFDYKTGLLVPLDIVEFFLETTCRSMFMTVLGADLLVKMNQKAWQQAQDFARSGAADDYDQAMSELGRCTA